MVATAGLELVQVPPLLGVTVAFYLHILHQCLDCLQMAPSLTTRAMVLLKVEQITPLVVVNLLLNLCVPIPKSG